MKKQPAVLYMIISILVLVIVGLTFIVVLQNSSQNENSETTLPQAQTSNSPTAQQDEEPPVGDVDQELLTPPQVQPDEERTTEIFFEETTRVVSGTVKSKNQTQIVIAEDVSGVDITVETSDTSFVEIGSYLTAECTNIQENVCQASQVDAQSAEEIN